MNDNSHRFLSARGVSRGNNRLRSRSAGFGGKAESRSRRIAVSFHTHVVVALAQRPELRKHRRRSAQYDPAIYAELQKGSRKGPGSAQSCKNDRDRRWPAHSFEQHCAECTDQLRRRLAAKPRVSRFQKSNRQRRSPILAWTNGVVRKKCRFGRSSQNPSAGSWAVHQIAWRASCCQGTTPCPKT